MDHGLSSDRKSIQPGMASMVSGLASHVADPQLYQQYYDLLPEYIWRYDPIHWGH